MERKDLALLCAGTICFWLFALAFGTAQDSGLRWVEAPAAAQTAVAGEEMQPAAHGGAAGLDPQLPRGLPDRPGHRHRFI